MCAFIFVHTNIRILIVSEYISTIRISGYVSNSYNKTLFSEWDIPHLCTQLNLSILTYNSRVYLFFFSFLFLDNIFLGCQRCAHILLHKAFFKCYKLYTLRTNSWTGTMHYILRHFLNVVTKTNLWTEPRPE